MLVATLLFVNTNTYSMLRFFFGFLDIFLGLKYKIAFFSTFCFLAKSFLSIFLAFIDDFFKHYSSSMYQPFL